jgi:hypothetical protein
MTGKGDDWEGRIFRMTSEEKRPTVYELAGDNLLEWIKIEEEIGGGGAEIWGYDKQHGYDISRNLDGKEK